MRAPHGAQLEQFVRPAVPPFSPSSALVVTLAGCSFTDVDQTTPGTSYEFNGATPAGQVIEAPERVDAPPFTGELLDGTPFDSADLAGDVSVINFWGFMVRALPRRDTGLPGRVRRRS